MLLRLLASVACRRRWSSPSVHNQLIICCIWQYDTSAMQYSLVGIQNGTGNAHRQTDVHRKFSAFQLTRFTTLTGCPTEVGLKMVRQKYTGSGRKSPASPGRGQELKTFQGLSCEVFCSVQYNFRFSR